MVHCDALKDALSIESLRPLHEVNQHCVEYLTAAARGEDTGFELSRGLGELLRGLSPAARRRAAERSFLLVDFEFRDAEWWRTARGLLQGARRPAAHGLGRRAFASDSTLELARSTLVLAWHTVRANRVAALVLLGITPPVATELAAMRLDELDWIAEGCCDHVRPRWEDRPAVWRRLLTAARDNDATALRDLTLHALQLLAGDLMPVTQPAFDRPRSSVGTA